MNILLAPDKFKGTLSAEEVCEAIKQGLLDLDESLHMTSFPLADGGEGTCALLTKASHGTLRKVEVTDPLFRSITADYGISGDGTTAFVEMAKASGLSLLKKEERNPLHTTTFGTGQLIAHAINEGASNIVVGIGGSATHDAGMGMASALGFEFLDEEGKSFIPKGESLRSWSSTRMNHVNEQLTRKTFVLLCDVDNPLYGPEGAAYMFGPQKGAKKDDLILLDNGLRHFEMIAKRTFNLDVNFPGAGAGGGIGAGARIFLHAEINRGFEFIAEYLKLEDAIRDTDLVITGEGRIDKQSLSGKVVSNVARLALKHQKPCMAIAGQSDLAPAELHLLHIIACAKEANAATPPENAARVLRNRTREEMGEWLKVKS